MIHHKIHLNLPIFRCIISTQNQYKSRHKESKTEICISHNFIKHEKLIEQSCDERAKRIGDIQNERRIDLIEDSVTYHEVETQHYTYIENSHEVGWIQQAKDSIELIEGQLAATKVITKADEVETDEYILKEKIKKSWFFRNCQEELQLPIQKEQQYPLKFSTIYSLQNSNYSYNYQIR